jgi:type IV secretory pathway VirD2 relaxase
MSKIKNWTVTSEAVKNKTSGLIKYINYLNNPNVDKHENTEIKNIFKDPDKGSKFIKKCSEEAISLDLKNAENGKGGRPVESYAVSFDFILPKNTIRPTEDQWKAIARDIYKVVKSSVDGNLTQDHVYMNIHDQDNPHLNLVVSKIIDGNRERKIDQKAILSKMKLQFNKSVLDHCDFDYKDYVPQETNLGPRQKTWQLDIKKLEKAHKQLKSLCEYINENNQKRINSTKNRMVKTLSQISENNQNEFFSHTEEIEDPYTKEILKEIREEIENLPANGGGGRPAGGKPRGSRPS